MTAKRGQYQTLTPRYLETPQEVSIAAHALLAPTARYVLKPAQGAYPIHVMRTVRAIPAPLEAVNAYAIRALPEVHVIRVHHSISVHSAMCAPVVSKIPAIATVHATTVLPAQGNASAMPDLPVAPAPRVHQATLDLRVRRAPVELTTHAAAMVYAVKDSLAVVCANVTRLLLALTAPYLGPP